MVFEHLFIGGQAHFPMNSLPLPRISLSKPFQGHEAQGVAPLGTYFPNNPQMHHFRKRKRPTPCPGGTHLAGTTEGDWAGVRPQRARSGLGLPPPVPGPYLAVLVDAFLSVFFSLRSSLFGLHFSQDLPSLCAVTQHLCLHSLPSAAAFSQQVCFFSGLSAAPTGPPNSEHRHPRRTKVFINFIIFNALRLRSRQPCRRAKGDPSNGLRLYL
jgi:hypothetical protein